MEFREFNEEGAYYSSGVLRFLPQQFLNMTPSYQTFNGDWIDGDNLGQNPDFKAQWIECFYPVSGSYAAAPRIINYVFILGALLLGVLRSRFKFRIAWLEEAILGVVMAYTSTTAIHALILVSARKRMATAEDLDWRKHEIVQVAGNWTGTYQTSTGLEWNQNNITSNGTRLLNDHLWMPVIPMVRDHDADPVLAVVGSAFLLYLPLQIWSNTMHKKEFRVLWYLWGLLLLIGVISALIYEEYTVFYNMWQLRFCPGLRRQDPLPVVNFQGDYRNYSGRWDGHDRYRWNEIVGEQFVFHNSTVLFPHRCLYPCFEVDDWPLRDPSDIFARRRTGTTKHVRGTGNTFLALYILIFVYAISCLALLALSHRLDVREGWWRKTKHFAHQVQFLWWGKLEDLSRIISQAREGMKDQTTDGVENDAEDRAIDQAMSKATDKAIDRAIDDGVSALKEEKPGALELTRRRVFAIWLSVAAICTAFLSLLTWIFLVGYLEWKIWSSDEIGKESMRHIGQWGLVVTTVLGFIAAGLVEKGDKLLDWIKRRTGWVRPSENGEAEELAARSNSAPAKPLPYTKPEALEEGA